MLIAPFEWLYRKLGPRYPKVFVAGELQAGFFVTAGDRPAARHLLRRELRGVRPADGDRAGADRPLDRLRADADPARAWTRSATGSPASATRSTPSAPGRRRSACRSRWSRDEMLIPIVRRRDPDDGRGGRSSSASPGSASSRSCRRRRRRRLRRDPPLPDARDRAAAGPGRHQPRRPAAPREPRRRGAAALAAAPVLPMINVITGWSSRPMAGADSLGVAVLAAIGVATTISLELTILLSRSILRPLADLQTATDAGRRGRLRRRGAGHHRRRDRRARRLVQRDGRGPARARADPRGVRHLPRPGGRRVHPQRGLLRGRRGRRGLDPVLRRQGLHQLRRLSAAPARSSPASTRCSRSSSRSSPPTAATSTSSRATG